MTRKTLVAVAVQVTVVLMILTAAGCGGRKKSSGSATTTAPATSGAAAPSPSPGGTAPVVTPTAPVVPVPTPTNPGDDHGDDAATATPLSLGVPAPGRIEAGADRDYFSLVLTAGTPYRFRTSNLQNGMDTVLVLIAPDGRTQLLLNDDFGGSDASQLDFTPAATGRFYVFVRHFDALAGTGDYAVTGESLGVPPAGPATAWVELGGSATGGGISNTGAPLALKADVAVDRAGTSPVVAWVQNRGGGITEVYLRRWNGTTWAEVGRSAQLGGISDTGGFSGDPSVALGPNGQLAVGWTEYVGSTLQIYVRVWNGVSWAELAGSASGGGLSKGVGTDHSEALALAWDASNRLVAAWEQRRPFPEANIYVRRWNGTTWEELGGSASTNGISGTTGANGASQMPSLAIEPATGYPVVAWLEGAPRDRKVHLRRWDGAAWAQLAGSATGGGISGSTYEDSPPPLALDALGRPTVAWSSEDATGRSQIYLRQFDGTAWAELAGSGSGGGLTATARPSRSPGLGLNPATGRPVLCWHEGSSSSGWVIHARRWSGAQWDELGASATASGVSTGVSGTAQRPAMAVDVHGRPVVAFEGGASGLEIFLKAWR